MPAQLPARLRRGGRTAALAAIAALGPPAASARAAEDAAAPAPAFKPGDVISFKEIGKLEPFLPDEFWDNRDFFFYEGMQLEIGPSDYDYSQSKEYL